MDYQQSGGVLNGGQPGGRLKEALGGAGPDLGQGSGSPLDGVEPGKRVKQALGRGEGGPDLGQGGMDELEVPDEPGPAAAGRTPLVGTVRRSNGMPVVRDELGGALGQ